MRRHPCVLPSAPSDVDTFGRRCTIAWWKAQVFPRGFQRIFDDDFTEANVELMAIFNPFILVSYSIAWVHCCYEKTNRNLIHSKRAHNYAVWKVIETCWSDKCRWIFFCAKGHLASYYCSRTCQSGHTVLCWTGVNWRYTHKYYKSVSKSIVCRVTVPGGL